MQRLFLVTALLLFWVSFAFAGTPSSYIGTNGNWSVATNWSTNPVVPLNSGPNTYDVTVSGRTVTFNIAGFNAIQTLLLSSGTLNLTSGNNLSVVDTLAATNSTVSAQGAAFSAGGDVSFTGSTLSVSSGGTITLPGLATFATNNSNSGTIQIDGSTSQMNLAHLTALALNGWGVTARAQNAGVLALNALTSYTNTGGIFESATFLATGANSRISANGFTALTMNSASITLQAQSGGYAEMTALATTNSSGNIFGNFNAYADGTGAKVNLPALTTMNLKDATNYLRATAGGDLELPLLATITRAGGEQLSLQASGAGSLLNAPLLGASALTRMTISVQTGGTILWGHPTVLTASSLTLDTSGTLDVSALTTIDSTSLTATHGANLSLPVTTFSTTSATSATWQADNALSTLQLPNLTSITLSGNDLTLQAQDGGDLELPALNSIATGSNRLNITSNGASSVVNMPNAPASLTRLNITIQSGGTLLWGHPSSLTASALTLDTSGALDTSSLTSIDSTNLTATNGANLSLPVTTFSTTSAGSASWRATNALSRLQLPNLTSITLSGNDLSLQAQNGGDIELPLFSTINYAGNSFEQLNLKTSGASSIINAPLLGVTPLTKLTIALQGGSILWANPTVLQASSVTIDTSGTIALAQLTNIDSTSFNAANGVSISLPNVTAIGTVTGSTATLQATGTNSTISLPAVTSFSNPGNTFGSINVTANGNGSRALLPALLTVTTDAASDTFQASNGGLVQANALTTVTSNGSIFGNFNVTADGTGSKVQFNALAVMHMNTAPNNITATNGGDVELPAITTITAAGSIFENLNVRSTGAGSLVNLASLRSTTTIPDALALANNGEIDLAGLPAPFNLSFLANFSSGSTGTLDVYLDATLLASITPNNPGTYMPYSYNVPAPTTSVVRFVASGVDVNVTLQDYAAVPEPASAVLLGTFALSLLCRRKHR